MQAFEYVRPKYLDDAARALQGNANAKLLAGGQTLLPTMKFAPGPAGGHRRSRRHRWLDESRARTARS
jgi:hypothetical protein